VRILVGKGQREFIVHRTLLCSASHFFQAKLDVTPLGLTRPRSRTVGALDGPDSSAVLWLSSECPETFELFVLWMYSSPAGFRHALNTVLAGVDPESPEPILAQQRHLQSRTTQLHWKLLRLFIFAAQIELPALQDICMDTIQDLYLRCDWGMTVEVLQYLYGECDARHSSRLRRWAVAMLAWTIYLDQDENAMSKFQTLLDLSPSLRRDYDLHVERMIVSQADIRIKNPQLRLPGNRLRSENRFFGFRQCSFHSHRREVGQGHCPHEPAQLPSYPPPETFEGEDGSVGASSDESVNSPPIRSTRLLKRSKSFDAR
jgi:hypothetical protein